jgi:hypothetical protein
VPDRLRGDVARVEAAECRQCRVAQSEIGLRERHIGFKYAFDPRSIELIPLGDGRKSHSSNPGPAIFFGLVLP